jgi:flavodoxin
MRAVIVYESMFGNTRHIADAIGSGLIEEAEGCVVSVVPIGQADRAQIDDADLIVVGGPTHVHGMTSDSTRKSAAAMAEQENALSSYSGITATTSSRNRRASS